MCLRKLGNNPFTIEFKKFFKDTKKFYLATSFNGFRNLHEYLNHHKGLSVRVTNFETVDPINYYDQYLCVLTNKGQR